MKKELLVEIEKTAKKYGAKELKEIEAGSVKVGEWVRLKCLHGCWSGESWLCPPATIKPGEFKEVLQNYSRALLIHFKEESSVHEAVYEIERKLFLAGYYKALGLAAGPCDLCSACNYPKPCRHPDKARPAMEAVGVDVFATARQNNFKIDTLKTTSETPNYFGLVLIE